MLMTALSILCHTIHITIPTTFLVPIRNRAMTIVYLQDLYCRLSANIKKKFLKVDSGYTGCLRIQGLHQGLSAIGFMKLSRFIRSSVHLYSFNHWPTRGHRSLCAFAEMQAPTCPDLYSINLLLEVPTELLRALLDLGSTRSSFVATMLRYGALIFLRSTRILFPIVILFCIKRFFL